MQCSVACHTNSTPRHTFIVVRCFTVSTRSGLESRDNISKRGRGLVGRGMVLMVSSLYALWIELIGIWRLLVLFLMLLSMLSFPLKCCFLKLCVEKYTWDECSCRVSMQLTTWEKKKVRLEL
ncbi:hypothetical protein BKA66DRAFT_61686 [Pyrenochaeta sp. MPI-SDFR-AT-0127]|nr:hypothetical protein BKA66DRAFT_61686 [Pyrenochaeta sp. MPI-SDFR-AT-0127]